MFNEKKQYDIKMCGFIKKVFFTGLTILSSVNLLAAAIILAPYGQKTLH